MALSRALPNKPATTPDTSRTTKIVTIDSTAAAYSPVATIGVAEPSSAATYATLLGETI
jgi:hypothetical protein